LGNYQRIFGINTGAKIETYNLFQDNKLDLKSFKEALEKIQGKKILILNFPNNPTGYSPTEKEAQEICDIIKQDAEKGNKILAIAMMLILDFFMKKKLTKKVYFLNFVICMKTF
jgi:aspartate/methionine/tyrosine aminotransferase